MLHGNGHVPEERREQRERHDREHRVLASVVPGAEDERPRDQTERRRRLIVPLLHREVELPLREQHHDACEDRERPGPDQDRADRQADQDDAGDERRRHVAAGPLAFGFGADLDRGRFLPARPAETLRADPNGPCRFGRLRTVVALLTEQLGDRDLLGGLRPHTLGLDVDLVPNGFGEVIGRRLDRLDVGCFLGDLGFGLLHQLGDPRFLLRAGEVDVAGRRRDGLRAFVRPCVVSLGLGLRQERPDTVLLELVGLLGVAGRDALGRGRALVREVVGPVGDAGPLGRNVLGRGFGIVLLRLRLERHGRATGRLRLGIGLLPTGGGWLVAPRVRVLGFGRLGPVDVLDRGEELLEVLEELLAFGPVLVLSHAQISLSSVSLWATTSSMSEMCLSVSFWSSRSARTRSSSEMVPSRSSFSSSSFE